MLRPVLNASRYLVIAAVVGSLAASLALFAYGARNGQYAIRIERALRALPEDTAAGEQHG